jgi:hypothetical protein
LTETKDVVQTLPPTETVTVERRNTIDILNDEADTLSLGKIIFFGRFLYLNRNHVFSSHFTAYANGDYGTPEHH